MTQNPPIKKTEANIDRYLKLVERAKRIEACFEREPNNPLRLGSYRYKMK